MMKNERSNRRQERVKKTERGKKRKKEANRKREIYKYSKLGTLNITSSQATCARKDISRIEQIVVTE